MNKGKKLLDIKPGETFQRGNFEFIVFEHRKNGTACLLKDFCKYMRFDEETGNYAHSQIRKYLNTEFYKLLAAEVGAKNIIKHRVNLTSDEGRKDYGCVTDKVSLLTCSLYRRYVCILNAYDEYNPNCHWWLASPVAVCFWNDYVRVVNGFGAFDDYGCNNEFGVRPFCILNSSISVS